MTAHRQRRAAGMYAPDPRAAPPPAAPADGDLDGLTRNELLERAEAAGLEVPSNATKAEIRAALEEAE